VHEAELTIRKGAAKLAISLHRGSSVRADLDDHDAIEDAVVVRAVRFERFNDNALVGMRRADLGPPRAMPLAGGCGSGRFLRHHGGGVW
jgi:hypothetical protein